MHTVYEDGREVAQFTSEVEAVAMAAGLSGRLIEVSDASGHFCVLMILNGRAEPGVIVEEE